MSRPDAPAPHAPPSQRAAERLDTAGFAAGGGAVMSWALAGVFIQNLDGVAAAVIICGRTGTAALVMLMVAALRPADLARALRSPTPILMGLYYVFSTMAFTRASVAEVTLIIGTSPIAALILERLAGRYTSPRQWMAAILAVVGLAAFLAPGSGGEAGGERWLGALLALGSAVASALYAGRVRIEASNSAPPHAASYTAASCLWGAVIAGVLALLTPGPLWTPSAPQAAPWLLLALGALCTAVPSLSFSIASSRLPPPVTASFLLATPLVAAVAAGVILAEWPPLAALPGAALTLLGLAWLIRAR